jgi:hypothetical protein
MGAAALILAALVVEPVGVADECACTRDREMSVHVRIDTENHSVLGFLLFSLSNDGDTEVVGILAVVIAEFRAFLRG